MLIGSQPCLETNFSSRGQASPTKLNAQPPNLGLKVLVKGWAYYSAPRFQLVLSEYNWKRVSRVFLP
jgi:hypothetical protein